MKWEVTKTTCPVLHLDFSYGASFFFLSSGSHAPSLIFISCRRSGIFCIKELYKLGKSQNVNEVGTVVTIFLSKRFDRAEAEKWAVERQVNRRRL
jgi:hypothetical protein